MQAISPKIASELANIVYNIRSSTTTGIYELHFSRLVLNNFEFDIPNSRVEARTGGVFGLWRKTSGFALVGHGKNQFAGHHVIAVRGTKTSHDWLTNGNVGLSVSSGGVHVHSGFNQAFESMRPTLSRILSPHLTRGSVQGVHCVGHSLGGALASLTGDWIRAEYRKPVKVYTFGAPRVGMRGFSTKSSYNTEGLYRCTHGADPVPSVPLWPFVHAPVNGFEYRLDNGSGISVEAHGMGPNNRPGYVNTANSSEWTNLHQSSLDYLNTPVRLQYERRHEASFTTRWAEKISAALITLLKDAGYYSAVMAQATISTSMTFYDLLARTLEQVAAASSRFAEQTRGLLGHMLAFARMAVTTVTDLTFRFIRWVFDQTAGALYRAVRQAIELT